MTWAEQYKKSHSDNDLNYDNSFTKGSLDTFVARNGDKILNFMEKEPKIQQEFINTVKFSTIPVVSTSSLFFVAGTVYYLKKLFKK